jgi:hypothetical protein
MMYTHNSSTSQQGQPPSFVSLIVTEMSLEESIVVCISLFDLTISCQGCENSNRSSIFLFSIVARSFFALSFAKTTRPEISTRSAGSNEPFSAVPSCFVVPQSDMVLLLLRCFAFELNLLVDALQDPLRYDLDVRLAVGSCSQSVFGIS